MNDMQLHYSVTHIRRSRFPDKDHIVWCTKGKHQYYGQENQFQKCDAYAEESVDWDSSVGHVFENEYDIEPGEEHTNSSHLPLPIGGTPTVVVKTKNEDENQTSSVKNL